MARRTNQRAVARVAMLTNTNSPQASHPQSYRPPMKAIEKKSSRARSQLTPRSRPESMQDVHPVLESVLLGRLVAMLLSDRTLLVRTSIRLTPLTVRSELEYDQPQATLLVGSSS